MRKAQIYIHKNKYKTLIAELPVRDDKYDLSVINFDVNEHYEVFVK